MQTNWTVLAALKAGREQVALGASEGAVGAIRSLQAQVPAPVRDLAYYSLIETGMRDGGQPSIGLLTQPRDATLALFDAAIAHLTSKLH